MIGLLVTLLVWVLIGGLVWWLIGLLPIDAKFKQIVQVILIVIFILLLIGLLYGSVPMLPMTR